MFGRRFLLTSLAGLAALLAYGLNQAPDFGEMEEPMVYRMVYALLSFSGVLVKTLRYLDIGTEYGIINAISGSNVIQASNENVQQTYRVINGIRVKFYSSKKLDKLSKVPGMVYYHGGGFFLGGIDGYDLLLSMFVENLGINVVSVDYRLAPDFAFPIPTEDSYSATNYVFDHADEFAIDPDRVVLAGDSAGGTIVAAVTQRLLKEGKKLPKLQVMIYPWLQMFNLKLPSWPVYVDTFMLAPLGISFGKMTKWYLGILDKDIELLIDHSQLYSLVPAELAKQVDEYLDVSLIADKYISDSERDFYKNYSSQHELSTDERILSILDSVNKNEKLKAQLLKAFTPEVSPVIAEPERLKGLPKAYLAIAEWDTLKDEGLIYAERLSRAGVDVTVNYYPKAIHGIVAIQQLTKSQLIARDVISFVRANL